MGNLSQREVAKLRGRSIALGAMRGVCVRGVPFRSLLKAREAVPTIPKPWKALESHSPLYGKLLTL